MQKTEFREPTYSEIAERAYLRWQAKGGLQGFDKKNWYAAETELFKRQAALEGVAWARETGDLLR
jgi:hypothetical protein